MKISELSTEIRKDELEKQSIDNTRVPKLTLVHLNKLRKIRELKELERVTSSKQLQIIYGSSDESAEQF